MVRTVFHPSFRKIFAKIKDKSVKQKLVKLFSKIRDNPSLGKPMRYGRKGTREVYIDSFRLSYVYDDDIVMFVALYHKDKQ